MAKKSGRQNERSSFGLENLEGRALLSASLWHKGVAGHNWGTQKARPTYRAAHLMGFGLWLVRARRGSVRRRMRHAYGVDSINLNGIAGDGSGQTIAIVDAYDDPTAASDLHAFDQAFGLADPPSFTKLNQSGGTALPGVDPAGKGNSWRWRNRSISSPAHAIAPQANIVLYEANSSSYNDLIVAAVNSAAQQFEGDGDLDEFRRGGVQQRDFA